MTELHTIEVRYEDVDGRHVDVHDAAREGHHSDGSFRVETGVCGCCDRTETTTVYAEDNVVKVAYGPSDHERVGRGPGGIDWWPVVAAVLLFIILFVVYWVDTGGTVSI